MRGESLEPGGCSATPTSPLAAASAARPADVPPDAGIGEATVAPWAVPSVLAKSAVGAVRRRGRRRRRGLDLRRRERRLQLGHAGERDVDAHQAARATEPLATSCRATTQSLTVVWMVRCSLT